MVTRGKRRFPSEHKFPDLTTLSFLRSMKLVSDLQDNVEIEMGVDLTTTFDGDVVVWAVLPEGLCTWKVEKSLLNEVRFLEDQPVPEEETPLPYETLDEFVRKGA